MVGVIGPELREFVANGGFIDCKDIHAGSCEYEGWVRFWTCFGKTTKFYLPVHLIPALILKRHKLRSQPWEVFKYFFKNFIRSSVMLAVYVTIFRYFLCFFKNKRHAIDRWNVILAGFMAPFFSIFFEPVSRRAELTVYMVPRWAEAFYAWLVKHGVARYVKNGEVILFAIAMAIICYCYQNEKDCIKPSYQGMFTRFFGEN